MNKERYTVECLAAGQPRPHADSVYHYRITVEWQGVAGWKDPENTPFVTRPELHESCVKPILRALAGGWKDEPDWHERRLEKCEMVAPGVWEVKIIEPYCD